MASTVPEVLRPEYFFDLRLMEYKELFEGVSYVWEAVKRMQEVAPVDQLTLARCESVPHSGDNPAGISASVQVRVARGATIAAGVVISGDGGLVCIDEGAQILPGTVITAGRKAVYIGRGAKVGPNAHLDATRGSICVGQEATLRHGSYLRELSLIALKATIGNSCEIKCSLIGPESQVPHFNYAGDSALGYKVHIGAGAKLSNLKITPDPKKADTIKVRCGDEVYDTGMRKLGAILGDFAQLGCNSVANPGTLVGKNSLIYAGSAVAGFIPKNTVVKLRQTLERSDIR